MRPDQPADEKRHTDPGWKRGKRAGEGNVKSGLEEQDRQTGDGVNGTMSQGGYPGTLGVEI